MRTMRRARAATSPSWVMRTTVRPSALSRAKIARISSVERESRLPVGSSARIERRIGDDRPRDRDALLLAAGELGGEVVERGRPCRPPPARRRPARRSAAPEPGVGERQLDVRQRRGPRHEVEALEDEADLAVAQVSELVLGDVADVDAVEQVAPGGGRVEAAEHVHQRPLAAARAAHDGHELAPRDAQRDAGQRADLDVLAQPVHALHVLHLDDRAPRAPRGGQRAHGVRPPRRRPRGTAAGAAPEAAAAEATAEPAAAQAAADGAVDAGPSRSLPPAPRRSIARRPCRRPSAR